MARMQPRLRATERIKPTAHDSQENEPSARFFIVTVSSPPADHLKQINAQYGKRPKQKLEPFLFSCLTQGCLVYQVTC